MGLFDSVFRRSRRVTDDAPTVPLPKTGLTFQVGNVQGVGLRERQEDSFAILNVSNAGALAREGLLAVVADGMGGMADGKQASESAVAALCQSFRERAEEMPVPQWFRESAHAVSDSVYEQFSGRSGTTLVAVHIQRNQLHWVSVGDSAIYLYRSGGVFQLNREHTYLNQLYTRELAEDIICKERAEQDEDARRLTAFVGIDRLTEVLGIKPGECTADGKFSLEACRCIGACGLAPVLTVNDEVYGRLTDKDIDGILAKYQD